MANPSVAAPASNLLSSSGPRHTLAVSSPSFWAAILACVFGIGLIIFSGYLFAYAETTTPLNVAVAVLGILECASALYSLRAVRVAWAFAISTNGTLAVVTLFCAPRIRDAAEISIVLALVPCIIFAMIVILHSLRPEDF